MAVAQVLIAELSRTRAEQQTNQPSVTAGAEDLEGALNTVMTVMTVFSVNSPLMGVSFTYILWLRRKN